jgi:hypothetical protein
VLVTHANVLIYASHVNGKRGAGVVKSDGYTELKLGKRRAAKGRTVAELQA